MNPSFEIHRNCFRFLFGLIFLCVLSFCVTAAKFSVTETGKDAARAARFWVSASLEKANITLRGQREERVPFTVSNGDGDTCSEVKIEYDLILTLPASAAERIQMELISEGGAPRPLQKTLKGSDAVYLAPAAGTFEAGKRGEHRYILKLRRSKNHKKDFTFSLSLSLFARQI